MSKDILYFPHDTNGRNDKKLQKLLMEHGVAGLGIYWSIIEMLHESGGSIEHQEYKRIAFELHVECSSIEAVIKNFDLFEIDEVEFWSVRVRNNLTEINGRITHASKAAKARWKKEKDARASKKDTPAMPLNKIKGNEIKGNEIKEEQKNTPPTPKGVELVFPELPIQLSEFKTKNPNKYTEEMYMAFLEYWDATVINGAGKGKSLWKSQKTWALGGRLATWASNNKNKSAQNGKQKLTPEQQREEARKHLAEKGGR